MVLLTSIYFGAMYGGWISSILLNIPGEEPATMTTLDGYPMAKAGLQKTALRCPGPPSRRITTQGSRRPRKCGPRYALLNNANLTGRFFGGSNDAINPPLEIVPNFSEWRKAVFHHGCFPVIRFSNRLQACGPSVEVFVRNVLWHVQATSVHGDHIDALFNRCRDVFQAWNALYSENGQQTDVTGFDEANNFEHVARHTLGEIADGLCDRISAAINADVFDVRSVGETGFLHDHQNLEVVETTRRRSSCKGNR